MTERTFTLSEARALIPEVRVRIDAIVAARANLAELTFALRSGLPSHLGGKPEQKGYEARIDEALGWFTIQGIEVKSIAPVLVDFPAYLGRESVRLCLLEGEHELGWYHRTEIGFAGRRRLPGSGPRE
ncbi:MAG: hypothetical protein JWP48_5349 [Actinoallomurus sp.]|nr:hypothetical protein [Actinoallomurus sp.]